LASTRTAVKVIYLLLDDIGVLGIFAFRILPSAIHDRGIDVGWAGCVGLVKQRYHREQYCSVRGNERNTKYIRAGLKMWSGNHKPYYLYPTETIGKRPFKVTK
jgi:hypothetical protein